MDEYKDDEIRLEFIKIALKNLKIFKWNVYKKKDVIAKEFENRRDKVLSITFPEAVLIPTKRGISDVGFNLQEIMTPNHIIVCGLLLAEPNDQKSIRNVIMTIKKTREMMIKMQLEYGERNNDGTLYDLFTNAVLVADAAYFTVKNLYYIYSMKINALIMPLKEAKMNNDKLREKNGETKSNDSFRKKFKRVLNGYICPMHHFMPLANILKINPTKNPMINLHFAERKLRYIFKSEKSCDNCPYAD